MNPNVRADTPSLFSSFVELLLALTCFLNTDSGQVDVCMGVDLAYSTYWSSTHLRMGVD